MLFKRLVSQLKPSVYLRFGVESDLLEEDRKRSSDLKVTETKLVNFDYLFGLAVVSYVALVVDSPVEVASSSLDRRPTSYKTVFDLCTLVKNLKTADKTLNQRTLPILWGSLKVELGQKLLIPDKSGSDF